MTFFSIINLELKKQNTKKLFSFNLSDPYCGLHWSLGQSIYYVAAQSRQEWNISTCKMPVRSAITMCFNRRQGGLLWLMPLLVIYSCCHPAQCMDMNAVVCTYLCKRRVCANHYFYSFTEKNDLCVAGLNRLNSNKHIKYSSNLQNVSARQCWSCSHNESFF